MDKLTSNAQDNLLRLVVGLSSGQGVPQDVSTWLLQGVCEFLVSGGCVPLDVSLGLRGRGIRSVGEQMRLEARNAALCSLAETIDDGNRHKPLHLAKELVRRADQFERRGWKRVKHLDNPPARLDTFDRQLFQILKAGYKIPKTPGHIVTLLEK